MAGEAFGLGGSEPAEEEHLARMRETLMRQMAEAGYAPEEVEAQLEEADMLGQAWNVWLRYVFIMAMGPELPELTDVPVAELQEMAQQGYEYAARGVRQITDVYVELERRGVDAWHPSWETPE